MDRSERLGLGIATAGHVLLLAGLSLGLLARPRPIPKISEPMDVQLTDAVGLRSTAPVVATEPPSSSQAPEIGPAKEAAPAEPEPLPPTPTPVPPKAVKVVKAEPVKPAPIPAKPDPKPIKAEPKPVGIKPSPAKPAPPAAAKPKAALDSDFLKSLQQAAKREGSSGSGKADRTTGSRLGKDFLKDIVQNGQGKGAAPRAAVGQMAMNGLGAAIKRQVEPCYAKRGVAGPGAERIRTELRLRLRPDGSLAAAPTLSDQSGVDDQNRRYAQREAEIAIAAVSECTPLKLPAELYKGGWEDIAPTFSHPGN